MRFPIVIARNAEMTAGASRTYSIPRDAAIQKSIDAWVDPFPWQFGNWIAASNGLLASHLAPISIAVLLAMTIWNGSFAIL